MGIECRMHVYPSWRRCAKRLHIENKWNSVWEFGISILDWQQHRTRLQTAQSSPGGMTSVEVSSYHFLRVQLDDGCFTNWTRSKNKFRIELKEENLLSTRGNLMCFIWGPQAKAQCWNDRHRGLDSTQTNSLNGIMTNMKRFQITKIRFYIRAINN